MKLRNLSVSSPIQPRRAPWPHCIALTGAGPTAALNAAAARVSRAAAASAAQLGLLGRLRHPVRLWGAGPKYRRRADACGTGFEDVYQLAMRSLFSSQLGHDLDFIEQIIGHSCTTKWWDTGESVHQTAT